MLWHALFLKNLKMNDLIIIGAGPGGYEMAAEAAQHGLKVVLVERDRLGGTCLNRGCIPTKTLCRNAEVLDLLHDAAQFGVAVGDVTVDYSQAFERKEQVVDQLRDGVAMLMNHENITLVQGEARIVSATGVAVGDEVYEARHLVIATGSVPRALPIEGVELAVTSDEILAMKQLPASLCIIGGGVIGMEFASIFHSYGVEVTVVEFCKEILPPFDKDIAKRLRTTLSKRGVNIITQAGVTALHKQGDEILVAFDHKGKPKELAAQCVLMSVGRKPVLPAGAEQLGVNTERGAIVVDQNMMTSLAGVYAIGDVNGLCMLAHAATAQGRVALAHILGHPTDIDLNVVPSAVFTRPEAAMVGLTEEQCAQRGLAVEVKKSFFRSNGKAVAMGETDGLVKLIADAESHEVLGCHICGAHAADLIVEVALAMSAHLPVERMASAIHGHPTLSEVVAACAAQFFC